MNPFKAFEGILKQHIIDKSYVYLIKMWHESHRHYHNETHLISVLLEIEKNIHFNQLSVFEKHALVLAAFFHDAIYDPKKNDNEDESINFFKASYKGHDLKFVKEVCDLIECTKYRKRPIAKLKRIFWDADNSKFYETFAELVRIDKEIRKEFSHVSNTDYKEGRVKFLESCKGLFNLSVDKKLIQLIKHIEKKYY